MAEPLRVKFYSNNRDGWEQELADLQREAASFSDNYNQVGTPETNKRIRDVRERIGALRLQLGQN